MKPPLLANEASRLKALADYHILDSMPEAAFDDLVKLASIICGCEMACVTLVDEHRQWFKARVGLEDSETPREHSFCAHAIAEPTNLMIVPDATRDARFNENPYVTAAPHIRFYAGAPLLSQDGFALGSLCVIDPKPHQPKDSELAALRILGRQASHLLELRRVNHALARALDNQRAS